MLLGETIIVSWVREEIAGASRCCKSLWCAAEPAEKRGVDAYRLAIRGGMKSTDHGLASHQFAYSTFRGTGTRVWSWSGWGSTIATLSR